MPRVYSPTSNESSAQEGLTHWRVFVSRPNVWPRAAFEDDGRVPFTAFTDGTSQTILVVEASEAVPWTKPDELIYDPNHPLPPLGSHFGDYFPVLFGDASVRFLPRRIREETLRALITRNGGERVTDDDY
jgi:hypothetical protein